MKLSIITINFNNLQGLKKTIDSIKSQTWKDFEWIVIDGGSTDGSRDLIVQNDKCFAYWCSERDGGVFNAMNKGIAMAKGEYLNFMNSGDIYHSPNSLQQVFSEAKTVITPQSPHVLYGNYYEAFSDGRLNDKIMPEDLGIGFLMYMPINHQSTFISRDLLAEHGYDETYSIIADWKAFMQWLMAGIPFYHLDTHVADFDMSGINLQFEDKKRAELARAYDEIIPKCVQITASQLHLVTQYPTLQRAVYLFGKNKLYFKIVAHIVKLLFNFDKLTGKK